MNWRIALAGSMAWLFASVSAAQIIPFNGTLQCTAPDPSDAVHVHETGTHADVFEKSYCEVTQPFALGRDQALEGSEVFSGQSHDSGVTGRGTQTLSMENGDKLFLEFHQEVSGHNGVPESSVGTFQITGGTGGLEGITGQGTLMALYNRDGSATVRLQGEYTLRASPWE
jgi:hypothetical protein